MCEMKSLLNVPGNAISAILVRDFLLELKRFVLKSKYPMHTYLKPNLK